MIKVLHVLGGPLDRGGITSFLKNYISFIDKSNFEFTVLSQGQNLVDIEDEFKKMSVHVSCIPYKSENLIINLIGLINTIRKGSFDIVHMHEDAMNILPMVITKALTSSVCVLHSHNTDYTSGSKIKRSFYNYVIKLTNLFKSNRIACSSSAGEWLFGKNKFYVLENAIDIDKYIFKNNIRNEIRKELSIHNSFVIGFIGRIEHQKNPNFIFELAKKMKTKDKEIFFLVIGGGKDLNMYLEKTKKLNNILFIGPKANVNDYLNSFDIFVMPSYFEGLGIAAIEAQSNGLHCLLSEFVPLETKVTDNVDYLELELDLWYETIISLKKRRPKRFNNNLVDSNYNISNSSNQLTNLYKEFLK